MSDHIIDRLKAQDATDPTRSSARIFLENYGSDRDEELCKILTDFISLADNVTLHGVQFVAPMRHASSDVRSFTKASQDIYLRHCGLKRMS